MVPMVDLKWYNEKCLEVTGDFAAVERYFNELNCSLQKSRTGSHPSRDGTDMCVYQNDVLVARFVRYWRSPGVRVQYDPTALYVPPAAG